MTNYELIKSNEGFLRLMSRNWQQPFSVQYLEIYEHWHNIVVQGFKGEYAVQATADAFKVSRRTIYRVIRRMKHEVTFA